MTLEAHSDVIKSAMQLSKDISKISGSNHQYSDPSGSELHMELQQHMDRVNSHKRRLSTLLASSESTSRIVRGEWNLLDQQSTEYLTFYTPAVQDTRLPERRSYPPKCFLSEQLCVGSIGRVEVHALHHAERAQRLQNHESRQPYRAGVSSRNPDRCESVPLPLQGRDQLQTASRSQTD